MSATVYTINKGINKPVEFRGLKAQYIWWLGAGLVGLLILFAIGYISGLNTFICLGLVIAGGTALFIGVYRISNRYGEHGMMKKWARRYVPNNIKSKSRKLFFQKQGNSF